MIDQPQVSIIMPVYNAVNHVEQAIQSVLDQDDKNWELLIINDGSTDESKQIISSFHDPRIKYHDQANLGVSAARNVGLALMTGDYFCFLDADDVLTRNSLSSRLKVFMKNKNIYFVDGVVNFIDESGKCISGSFVPKFKGNPINELIALSDSCFFGPTWMIKRKPDIHYQFNENMTHAEDLAFYISIAEEGMYSHTDQVILQYRKHKSSAMGNLKGLEHGYIQLIRYIDQIKPRFSNYGTRFKAVKIMFLSHLITEKNPFRALLSIFRILSA